MSVAAKLDDEQLVEVALIAGYLAFIVGIIAAYTSPADGYELSIYTGTPLAFWVALVLVGLVSVTVSLYDDRYLPAGLLLGGLGAASVAGLPLIRGYHFLGRADSLVHLGLTRSIDIGNDPLDLLYPGSHLVATSVSKVAAIDVPRAMMLVLWVYTLVFFVGVALCVWTLIPDRRALAVGAFSAFLLLPINTVSTHLHFHTYSIGMLFVPFVLFLAFTHLIGGDPWERTVERIGDGGGTATHDPLAYGGTTGVSVASLQVVPTSYLLPTTSVALVLFHPQIALNVMLLFGGISVAQHWYRRYRPNRRLANYRLLTYQTAFLLVMFAVWILAHDWAFVSTAESMIESVTNFIAGTGETAPRVGSQTDSAKDIGVSIGELFAKLFGVSLVYAFLAAGVVVGWLTGYLGRPSSGGSPGVSIETGRDITALFSVGLFALLPFFALHFVGSISTYLFRHVGFLMMLATVFGAVGLRYLLWGDDAATSPSARLRSVGSRLDGLVPGSRAVLTVLVVLLAVSFSLVTVFPSPYIYSPGTHVSEGEMDGYQNAFASQSPEAAVWFGGVRHSSERYEVALYGAASAPWDRQVMPPPKKSAPVPESAMLNSLIAFYENHPEEIVQRDHYFVVAEADRQREVGAYRELRYSEASFEAVEAQPNVGKVRDNGEFTVYFVDIAADEFVNTSDDGTGVPGS